ncbi:hypothetical protein LAZ67_6002419 [Cordylochernes scorpioides]|uniref:Uncharacterized protein n=1 Tax=Cordylochernes scorpioides TaxID=51811 RepID=A0ABY6KJT1_9ARAC|nr:hypothetical protein LAZ67_6002419 [Cordylochernes scorpioides]
MDKLKRERTPLRNTITRTTNEIKSEAQINDEMEQCETYSLQVGIVAQKVKEYESKLAAPCDDKMSQSSTSDVKRQIKLPKFELKRYTGELEE